MSKLESYSSFLVLSTKQSFEQKRATDMKQANMTVAKKQFLPSPNSTNPCC